MPRTFTLDWLRRRLYLRPKPTAKKVVEKRQQTFRCEALEERTVLTAPTLPSYVFDVLMTRPDLPTSGIDLFNPTVDNDLQPIQAAPDFSEWIRTAWSAPQKLIHKL